MLAAFGGVGGGGVAAAAISLTVCHCEESHGGGKSSLLGPSSCRPSQSQSQRVLVASTAHSLAPSPYSEVQATRTAPRG